MKRDDSGVTLAEVMVSMSVMSVMMAIFTTGVVSMFRSADKQTAIADSVGQVNDAFVRLDRSVRYASYITTPGQISGDWYVEFLTSSTSTSSQCTQLRLNTTAHALQQRVWTQNGTVGKTWATLASQVYPNPAPSGGTAPPPFVELDPTGNLAFQQLKVQLTSMVGSGVDQTSTQTVVVFAALNTTRSITKSTPCSEGRTS